MNYGEVTENQMPIGSILGMAGAALMGALLVDHQGDSTSERMLMAQTTAKPYADMILKAAAALPELYITLPSGEKRLRRTVLDVTYPHLVDDRGWDKGHLAPLFQKYGTMPVMVVYFTEVLRRSGADDPTEPYAARQQKVRNWIRNKSAGSGFGAVLHRIGTRMASWLDQDKDLADFWALDRTFASINVADLQKVGSPIWAMSDDAYDAFRLTETPWPELRQRGLPRLPYPSMLVEFPPNAELYDTTTFRDAPKGKMIGEIIQAVLQGHGLPGMPITSARVQELIPGKRWFFNFYLDTKEGFPIPIDFLLDVDNPTNRAYADVNVTANVIVNMMLALEQRAITTEEVKPSSRRHRRARRKGAVPKGRVTRIDLSSAIRQKQRAMSTEHAPKRDMVRHPVRGHYKGYWVLDPEDQPVLAVRPRTGAAEGNLHKILRWLPPFFRGNLPAPPGQRGRYRMAMTAAPRKARPRAAPEPKKEQLLLPDYLQIPEPDLEYEEARKLYIELLEEFPGSFGGN